MNDKNINNDQAGDAMSDETQEGIREIATNYLKRAQFILETCDSLSLSAHSDALRIRASAYWEFSITLNKFLDEGTIEKMYEPYYVSIKNKPKIEAQDLAHHEMIVNTYSIACNPTQEELDAFINILNNPKPRRLVNQVAPS